MSAPQLTDLDMALAQLRVTLKRHEYGSVEIRLRQDGRVSFSFCGPNGWEIRAVHADLVPDSDGKYPSEALAAAFTEPRS